MSPILKGRKKRSKQAKDPVASIFEEAEETPVGLTAKAYEGTRKRYVWMRRLLIWSPPFTLISCLSAVMVGAIYINGFPEVPEEFSEVRVTEVGRTQAEESLQIWLDQNGAAFGKAVIASWDGVEDRVEAVDSEDGIAFTEFTHLFTIRAEDGTYYRAGVRTAYSDGHGSKVIGTPTITPLKPSSVGDWDPKRTVEDWASANPSDSVTAAVQSWAEAMTASPQELKIATRDEDDSHVYSTLTGVSVESITVNGGQSPARNGSVNDPTTMVVTVTVNLKRADAEDGAEATPVSYDVLVRGADTAAPYVTAWGTPGTGTMLSDHENATSLSGEVDGPVSPAPSDGGGEQNSPAASDGGGTTGQ